VRYPTIAFIPPMPRVAHCLQASIVNELLLKHSKLLISLSVESEEVGFKEVISARGVDSRRIRARSEVNCSEM
jgi:hypothetical protein